MSVAFVLDCSLAMTWAFTDERTDETDGLLGRTARELVLVPAHWFLEVSNTSALAVRHGRLPELDARRFLYSMQKLNKQIDAGFAASAFVAVFDFAIKFRLSAYDATYLELAQRRKLPLASLDDDHRAEAVSLGIPVLGK